MTATLLQSFRISPNFRAFSLMMSNSPPVGARTRGSNADTLLGQNGIHGGRILWSIEVFGV